MAYADTIRTTIFTASDIATLIDGLVTADINSTYTYAGVASGTNTITASLTQAPSAYVAGQQFIFISGGTNTGSATLNINSLGAITIYDAKNNQTLIGGEMRSGSAYKVIYYNSKFFLINGGPGRATWTPSPTGFSAAPSNTAHEYWRNGNIITAVFRASTNGTSNGTGFTCSAPVAAATLTNGAWCAPVLFAYDNGAAINTALAYITSGSSTITLNTNAAGAGWTAANAKGGNFTLSYPFI